MTDQPSMTTKRVFITGAASLLGTTLTRHLRQAGHAVIGTVNGKAEAARIRADGGIPAYPDLMRAGEIRAAMTALGKENVIAVNLAPQLANHAPFFPVKWDETIRVLDEGTPALIDAARMVGVEFLIHGSYAFAELHSDDDTLVPVLSAVRRAESLVLNSGIPALVLRFGYVYGDSDALRGLLSTLKAGRPVFTSDAHAQAAWVEAHDAARAIIAALDARPEGRTLTVSADRSASPAEFLAHFAAEHGLSAPTASPLTAPLARLSLGAAQYALLNAHSHADNATAKSALGWSPRFTTLQSGLDDMLLTWRAHNLEKV
jgi:nucleoside-diphosphate-sugar epimerase